MYVSLTRTSDPQAKPIRLATIAGEEMLPWLSEYEGFEGLLMLSNGEQGTTLVLTFWASEEAAEAHSVARAQFRESMTAAVDVQVVDTTGYEVTFAALGSLALPDPGDGDRQ